MSNKHNYSQYSNKNNNQAPKKEKPIAPAEFKMEVAPAPAAKPIAPVEPAKPVLVQEVVETAPLPKTVSGVVTNCSKLNVRAEPSLFADVVCVLDAETEIKIDVAQSNRDWFKIYTAIGVDGYCMRRFVNAYM